jgi:hypothetical protein
MNTNGQTYIYAYIYTYIHTHNKTMPSYPRARELESVVLLREQCKYHTCETKRARPASIDPAHSTELNSTGHAHLKRMNWARISQ